MITLIGDLGFDIRRKDGKKLRLLGGSGFHAAAGAVIAQGDVLLVSCVGADFDLSRMLQCGIPCRHIRKYRNRRSSQFIIEGNEDTRRVRFNHWPFPVIRGIWKSNEIRSSHIIHLTAASPVNQLSYIRAIQKSGYAGLISVDVFDQHCARAPKEVLAVIDHCDIVFMNHYEQRLLDYREIPQEKTVVIKHGADGAECHAGGEVFSSRYVPRQVADTIGAGDILCGAFLSSLDKGLRVEAALDLAVRLATESVEHYGSEAFLRNVHKTVNS